MVVSIDKVIPLRDDVSKYFVSKMAAVLEKQGQIEPLQVTRADNGYFIVWNDDAHGNEIVHAARNLGWHTLLVVVTDSYIE